MLQPEVIFVYIPSNLYKC
uniref:Uncharacterized protein n=1 Tax=Rhizophora mucronata TaxID=61149 RepID=A0A2P2QX91_RHIMU